MSAYTCPFCDYGAPLPNSVKGHITASSDDDHKGESGPEFSEDDLLAADEHPEYRDPAEQDDDEPEQVADAPDDEQDGADAPAPEQPTETPTDGAETEASADGGSGIVPEADAHTPSSDSADDSATECPDCGNDDLRDAGEHLEDYRARLEEQHIDLLESNDHVCRSCGGVF